ncbi:MAG: cytochrome c5 [Bacteroidia bacterium]|jgi:cytochrome c5
MKKFCAVLLMVFSAGVVADAEEKYNKYCTICHSAGVANAPKTGDIEAWAPRLAKGMDALVASSIKGMGAMPAKGMCQECTPDDFKALIEYMSTAK